MRILLREIGASGWLCLEMNRFDADYRQTTTIPGTGLKAYSSPPRDRGSRSRVPPDIDEGPLFLQNVHCITKNTCVTWFKVLSVKFVPRKSMDCQLLPRTTRIVAAKSCAIVRHLREYALMRYY